MSDTINLAGVDKAKVLAALYNASHPQGMGFLHATPEDMTVEEARGVLGSMPKEYTAFDYLKGRVMKIDLTKDELDPRLYDRDNGPGAAAKALEGVINGQKTT